MFLHSQFPVSVSVDAAKSLVADDVDRLVVCSAPIANGGGHVDICFDGPGGWGDVLGYLSPDEARQLAAALLAASARIEGPGMSPAEQTCPGCGHRLHAFDYCRCGCDDTAAVEARQLHTPFVEEVQR